MLRNGYHRVWYRRGHGSQPARRGDFNWRRHQVAIGLLRGAVAGLLIARHDQMWLAISIGQGPALWIELERANG